MESKDTKPISSVYVNKKKAHKDAIISIDVMEQNNDILATCSEDKTIRLWDLRIDSSIKQYKDPLFVENQPSNAKFSADGSSLFVGAGNHLLTFDVKTDKILIDSCSLKKESTRDEINFVTASSDGKFIASCDDSHDVRIFDPSTLDLLVSFEDVHKNIPFSLEFINPGDKPVPYCVSSGFDSTVIFWDLEKKAAIKSVNLVEMCNKYIKGQLVSPPLVYNLCVRQSTVLASVETGHIIAFTFKEPKKPKYIIDAHLGKVMRSTFCRFNENVIASVSNDLSFAFWDVNNRNEYGVPDLMRRVEVPNKPNWLETTKDKKVLVGDTSEFLYIYSFKE